MATINSTANSGGGTSLSDILTALQNGVVAINGLNTQVQTTFASWISS